MGHSRWSDSGRSVSGGPPPRGRGPRHLRKLAGSYPVGRPKAFSHVLWLATVGGLPCQSTSAATSGRARYRDAARSSSSRYTGTKPSQALFFVSFKTHPRASTPVRPFRELHTRHATT